jgi:hypothetical protein
MRIYNKNMELVGIINDKDDQFVEVTANERETFNNLFEELERVAEAVKKFGGVWWSKKIEDKPTHQINTLVVTANGSIAAAGYNATMYPIHPVYINKDGYPVMSEWTCDPSLMRSDDPTIMLNPEKWRSAPAFMVYSIETGEFTIKNKSEMLKKYQNSLDDVRESNEKNSIAASINSIAASINSQYRIGGNYVNCEL